MVTDAAQVSKAYPGWAGPHLRDYTINVPKKVKALAFRKALSERLLAGDVLVVADLALAEHKTKVLAQALVKLAGPDATVLLVAEKVEKPTKSSDGLKTYSVYGVEVALPFRPNRLSGKTKAMQKAGKTAAEIAAYWIGEFKNGTLERRPAKASAAV